MLLVPLVLSAAVILGAEGSRPDLKLSVDACRVSGRDRLLLVGTLRNQGREQAAALAPGWNMRCETEFRCTAGSDGCEDSSPVRGHIDVGRGRKLAKSVLPNFRLLSPGASVSDVVMLGDDSWRGPGQYRWVCTNDASLSPDDRIGFFMGLWSLDLDGGWSTALGASPRESEAAAVVLNVPAAARTQAPTALAAQAGGAVRLEINSCEQNLDGGGTRIWLLPTLLLAENRKDEAPLVVAPDTSSWGSCRVKDARGRTVFDPDGGSPPPASWGLGQMDRGRLLGAMALPDLSAGTYTVECGYHTVAPSHTLGTMLERLGGNLDASMAARLDAASFDGDLTAKARLTVGPGAASAPPATTDEARAGRKKKPPRRR